MLDTRQAPHQLGASARASALQPIGRLEHSFTDRAYVALKRAIVSLEFAPGSTLSERQLVEQLQVSKTPVREALARLEREGFVVTVPYRGTLVTTLSHIDIQEIFDLRALLEGHAVYQAIPRLTGADRLELRGHLEAADAAAARGDTVGFFEANHGFHRLLIARASNRRLREQLANLEDHTRRIRAATASVWQAIGMSLQHHWALLRAAESGDAESAQAEIQHDIREFEARLLSHTSAELVPILAEAPTSTEDSGFGSALSDQPTSPPEPSLREDAK